MQLLDLQNVLIGMDIPRYENRRMYNSDYTISESDFSEDITFHDDYSEASNNLPLFI